jgi:hypothetical protein
MLDKQMFVYYNDSIKKRTCVQEGIVMKEKSIRKNNTRRNRNKLSILAAFVCSLIIVTFMAGALINFKADAHESDMQNKYYQSIRIEKGDSLWSIANRYRDPEHVTINQYMDELRTINDLDSDVLIAGNYLSVVCYADCTISE